MSNPVNLNRFRKQKARTEKRQLGDVKAARHGQTKAERELIRARAEKAKRDLNGHETE